jgi:hypothetical protein
MGGMGDGRIGRRNQPTEISYMNRKPQRASEGNPGVRSTRVVAQKPNSKISEKLSFDE